MIADQNLEETKGLAEGSERTGNNARRLHAHELMIQFERAHAALPLHAVNHVEQHTRGLNATGQIAVMHGRDTARQRTQKGVVAKTAHAMGALSRATHLIDRAQHRRHGIGRTGNKVKMRIGLQQLTRGTIAESNVNEP